MLSHPIVIQSQGYLLPALAGIAGVLLALGAWNVTLRRRIAQRTCELTREIEAGKQRAEELRLSEELLRRSEEKYRQIYENAPIAIFQSTLEGRFLSLNPAAAAMFLYQSPQEMITSITNIPEQLFVHPEQRSELLRCLLASDGFLRREVEYIRKDDTAFSANLYMRAVRSGEEVLYLEGFVEDITERKHAYELTRTLNVELEQRVHERTVELEQANTALHQEVEHRKKAQYEISCLNDGLLRQRTALEAANNELESFSYSVSHDLRAPLRHICGFTSLLVEDCGAELDEKAQAYLERIIKSSTKMQELIDGLLSLSRVSRGELNTVSLNLSIYAREIAQELQQAEPERAATFVIPDHLPASADPVLIRSVLQNLFSNAWKYSSKKEAALIEFGCEEREGERVYYLRDNGAGFDMAYAGNLFGVFQRMHPPSEFEGTGIGLATVQRIIRRHGGRIWAESEVGKGATFFFTLPSYHQQVSGT